MKTLYVEMVGLEYRDEASSPCPLCYVLKCLHRSNEIDRETKLVLRLVVDGPRAAEKASDDSAA